MIGRIALRCSSLLGLAGALCLEAEAWQMSHRYGPQSAEARVAWSEVETLRERLASETPKQNTEKNSAIFDRLAASRNYATWLRRTRNEIRRREASRVFLHDLNNLAFLPFELQRERPKRSDEASLALARRAAAETDPVQRRLLYVDLEEVLAADNAVASRPSLDELLEEEDNAAVDAASALYVEMALDLLECISWKAEHLGAFGMRRLEC